MEHYKIIENLILRRNELLDLLAELKEKEQEKYNQEMNSYNQSIKDRIEDEIKKLKEDAHTYIEQLNRSIHIHEETIRAARKFHADNIIARADEIVIDGKKFFEGMNKDQIENFSHGHFAIEEHYERKKIELAFKRDQDLEKIEQPKGGDRKQVLFQSDKSNKETKKANILKRYNDDLAALFKIKVANLKRLVKETGAPIDPNTNDTEFMEEFGKYESNNIVKTELNEFIDVFHQEYTQIIEERNQINELKTVNASLDKQKSDSIKNVNDAVNFRLLFQQPHYMTHLNTNKNASDTMIDKSTNINIKSTEEIFSNPISNSSENPRLKEIDFDSKIDNLDELSDFATTDNAFDEKIDALDELEDLDSAIDNKISSIEDYLSNINITSLAQLRSMDEINFSIKKGPSNISH